MKKFIFLLITALCLVSCKDKRDTEYVVTYNMYYSNTPTIKTYTFKAEEGTATAFVFSDRGSHHLHIVDRSGWLFANGRTIESSSAPIEIVSVRRKN